MKECETKKVSVDGLEKTIGGVNFGTEKADEICDAIGEIFEDYERVKTAKISVSKMWFMECWQL